MIFTPDRPFGYDVAFQGLEDRKGTGNRRDMQSWLVSRLVQGLVAVIFRTCRMQFFNDQRPQLKRQGTPYIYGVLHGHQLSMIPGVEPKLKAMVSKSKDGELIAEAIRRIGCDVVRGSKKSHQRERGGREAVDELIRHIDGGGNGVITVDGPRGPRGRVHKGLAMISQKTGAPILLLIAIPTRRLIATRAWDRMQIPLPWSRIDGYFSDPIFPIAGEKLETYRKRIETEMRRLEEKNDPREAAHNPPMVVHTSRDGEPQPAEANDADAFDEDETASIANHPHSGIPTDALSAQMNAPQGDQADGDAQRSRRIA